MRTRVVIEILIGLVLFLGATTGVLLHRVRVLTTPRAEDDAARRAQPAPAAALAPGEALPAGNAAAGATGGLPPPAAPRPPPSGNMVPPGSSAQQVREYKTAMLQRRDEALKRDVAAYGAEVLELFKRADLRLAQGARDHGAADLAFTDLCAKYPQSKAAGIALAERALDAAQRNLLGEVEALYAKLAGNPTYADAVTENGVEAVPAILGFLAAKYMESGQDDKALAAIDALEQQYGAGLMALRGPADHMVVVPVRLHARMLRGTLAGEPGPPDGP